MWSLCAVATLIGFGSVSDPLQDLDPMLGQWVGSIESGFIRTQVYLNVQRQGQLLILDLQRDTLLHKNTERIYVDASRAPFRAVSLTDYVPDPRKDTPTISKTGLNLVSEPWTIGKDQKIELDISLLLGRLVERPRARIQLSGPEFVPDPQVITMIWGGKLNGEQLKPEQGELRRKQW